MTTIADFNKKMSKVNEEMSRLRKSFAESGKELLVGSMKGFFQKYPAVESVFWRQYTPYFNDGEPCEFQVHEQSLRLRGTNEEQLAFIKTHGELYSDYTDSQLLDYFGSENLYGSELSAFKYYIRKDLEDLLELKQDKDTMEALFGDHVEVILNREGVTVKECSHD